MVTLPSFTMKSPSSNRYPFDSTLIFLEVYTGAIFTTRRSNKLSATNDTVLTDGAGAGDGVVVFGAELAV